MKNKPPSKPKPAQAADYRKAILEQIEKSGDSVYDIAREEEINRRTLQDFLHKTELSKQQEIMQKLLNRYNLRLVKNRKTKSAKPRGE